MHQRYFGLLHHNLETKSILSSENAWIFRADERLAEQIETTVKQLTTSWLSTQSNDTVQRIVCQHAPIGTVVGSDVERQILSFLAPNSQCWLTIPIVPQRDSLSDVMLVNKRWNSLADGMRYQNLDNTGIFIRKNLWSRQMRPETFVSSFSAFWASHNFSTLNLHISTQIQDDIGGAIFDGLQMASLRTPKLRIRRFEVNTSAALMSRSWLDPRIPMFSELERVVLRVMFHPSWILRFLRALQQTDHNLKELGFGLAEQNETDVRLKSLIFDIPGCLPSNLEEFHCTPFMPDSMIQFALRCLPHLKVVHTEVYENDVTTVCVNWTKPTVLALATLQNLERVTLSLKCIEMDWFFDAIEQIILANERLTMISLLCPLNMIEDDFLETMETVGEYCHVHVSVDATKNYGRRLDETVIRIDRD